MAVGQTASSLTRRRLVAGAAAGLTAATFPRRAVAAASDVVAAAKKEGKVVVWGTSDLTIVRRIVQSFNRTYPDIDVEYFRLEAGPATERLITEHAAKQVNVDALETPVGYIEPLIQRDLLDRFTWRQTFNVGADYVLYDRRVVQIWNVEIPLCCNTDKVKPSDVKSWDDVLDPRWKGQVLLEARGQALATLALKWGEAKTLDYIKRLKANDAIIMLGGTPLAEALASGRAAFAIGTYAGKIDLMKQQGAPVDWLLISPIPATKYLMVVPKGAPHVNAARVWIAWLASPEGQAVVYEQLHYGFLVGNTLSPNGRKMRAAGVQVVVEADDPARERALLELVSGAIGALK